MARSNIDDSRLPSVESPRPDRATIRGTHMTRFVSLAILLAASPASAQIGRELTPAEKRVVGERIAKVANFAKDLDVAEGDTLFVVYRERVASNLVPKDRSAYEAFVNSYNGPAGILVDPRVDELTLVRMGAETEVSFRYALTVAPGTGKGGNIKFQLDLVERQGLGNSVASSPILFQNVNVVPPKLTATDLAADFVGYRIYARLAVGRRAELTKAGVNVALTENAKLPPMLKVPDKVFLDALEFDLWRRRMWVAERHLRVASTLPDRAISASARKLQTNLNVPDDQLKDLPDLTLVTKEETDAKVTVKDRPKTVKRADGSEELVPLEDKEEEEKPLEPVRPEPDKPKVVVEEKAPEKPQDTFERKKETPIPVFHRPLILDDANIAHTLAIRASYAEISLQEKAIVPSFFLMAQLAVTRDVGIELTQPLNLIAVDVDRTKAQAYLGNPLVALKYRIHMPSILGRQPALTIRARYGMPIWPLHTVPPTDLGAEAFSLPANFTDTYAFLLEKHDLGIGASLVWAMDMFTFRAQAYGDYFLAVPESRSRVSFPALSFGVGMDARPIGDWLGFYLEGRTTSLLAGPRRTELFTYLGARARFGIMEPALWFSLPVGTVASAGSPQIGLEFRVAYDVEAVITRGAGQQIEAVQFLKDDSR